MTGLLELGRRFLVWQKGRPIPGLDPSVWRADRLGNTICNAHYGDRASVYGWEIDHWPMPRSLGGGDDLDNLQPLACRANALQGGLLSVFLDAAKR